MTIHPLHVFANASLTNLTKALCGRRHVEVDQNTQYKIFGTSELETVVCIVERRVWMTFLLGLYISKKLPERTQQELGTLPSYIIKHLLCNDTAFKVFQVNTGIDTVSETYQPYTHQ